MKEPNHSSFTFTIQLESQDYIPEDSEWQEECRQFYNNLYDEIEEGELEPNKKESREGDKSGFIELFNEIVTYGISIGGFSAMYQLSKLWLDQRSNCDIVLKFPDGSEMKMRGLSPEEAEQKMQEHQQKYAQKNM